MFLHCVNQYWQIKLFPAVFCNHSHKIYREKACWGPRGGGGQTTPDIICEGNCDKLILILLYHRSLFHLENR